MPFYLTNTLTGNKEVLRPVRPGAVSFYACGPTVYDVPHIGHVRSAAVFDWIRRALERQYRVTFVRNITDIDDKIIQRAAEESVSCQEISERYAQVYHTALKAMQIQVPTHEPRATDQKHIQAMIALIQELLDKGLAYTASGHVYFCVRRYSQYGNLSHQQPDAMLANVRIEPGEGKADPLDFALWKKSSPGEPRWKAPWGEGRPGWHIECSAMSMFYLGETFDIHGGGRDLLFPHHENEIAQSVGATGKAFARVWIHHGLLSIEGKKMSKSLGNFISIAEVQKRFSLDCLRLLFLQSHYRHDIDFSWKKMESLEESRRRFETFFAASLETVPESSHAEELSPYLKKADREFWEALEDDLDTPKALAVLFNALHEGNRLLKEDPLHPEAGQAHAWIKDAAHLFGLFQKENKTTGGWSALLESLNALRDTRRREGRYHVSDFIRDELLSMGFKSQDRKEGITVMSFALADDHAGLEKALKALLKKAEAMH